MNRHMRRHFTPVLCCMSSSWARDGQRACCPAMQLQALAEGLCAPSSCSRYSTWCIGWTSPWASTPPLQVMLSLLLLQASYRPGCTPTRGPLAVAESPQGKGRSSWPGQAAERHRQWSNDSRAHGACPCRRAAGGSLRTNTANLRWTHARLYRSTRAVSLLAIRSVTELFMRQARHGSSTARRASDPVPLKVFSVCLGETRL